MVVGESLLDIEGKTFGAVDHADLKGNVADRIKGQRLHPRGVHQQSVGAVLFVEKHIIQQRAPHSQSIVGTPDTVHGLWGMVIGFPEYLVPFLSSDKVIVSYGFAEQTVILVLLRDERIVKEEDGRNEGKGIQPGSVDADKILKKYLTPELLEILEM